MGTELMEREPEVVEAAPDLENMTLEELAQTANESFSRGTDSAAAALRYWLMAGDALTAIKDRIEPSGWIPWLNSEAWVASQSWGQFCVRASAYRAEIESAGVSSTKQAKQLLAGLPPVEARRGKDETPALKARARKLRAAGFTNPEIARMVGKHPATVWAWLTPGAAERKRAANRAHAQRVRDEERARERQTVESSVRGRKDAVGDLYSLIRKATQLCDQGKSEVEDREGKLALAEAEALLHRADAAIVTALGLK